MRAWIPILDAPGCYERAAQAERKSALLGSGVVRTVGPCAQRRVAIMPWAIATARDTLSNDRCKSATHFERPVKPPGLERSERRGLFFIIPVSSPVATFKQSENVAIAHLVGAACYEGCGLCNRFHLRMRTVLMGNLAQAGYCLCMNYVSVL